MNHSNLFPWVASWLSVGSTGIYHAWRGLHSLSQSIYLSQLPRNLLGCLFLQKNLGNPVAIFRKFPDSSSSLKSLLSLECLPLCKYICSWKAFLGTGLLVNSFSCIFQCSTQLLTLVRSLFRIHQSSNLRQV